MRTIQTTMERREYLLGGEEVHRSPVRLAIIPKLPQKSDAVWPLWAPAGIKRAIMRTMNSRVRSNRDQIFGLQTSLHLKAGSSLGIVLLVGVGMRRSECIIVMF
jgi:hypothetical protein